MFEKNMQEKKKLKKLKSGQGTLKICVEDCKRS